MSPRELQGRYNLALGKIGSANDPEVATRHKPIYQRDPQMTEQQAIEEAAKALRALWQLSRSDRKAA